MLVSTGQENAAFLLGGCPTGVCNPRAGARRGRRAFYAVRAAMRSGLFFPFRVATPIRESYRNPVMHPEVRLEIEDAEILLSLCTSAIIQMVKAIQALQSTVAAPDWSI